MKKRIVALMMSAVVTAAPATARPAPAPIEQISAPAHPSYRMPSVRYQSLSDAGFLYTVATADLPVPAVRLLRSGSDTPETIGAMSPSYMMADAPPPSLVGPIVALPTLDDSGRAVSVELRDLRDDSSRVVTIPAGRRYVGQTGDGGILVEIETTEWTGSGYAKELHLVAADETMSLLMDVRNGVVRVIADTTGILIQVRDPYGGNSGIRYLDRATGSVRLVTPPGTPDARSAFLTASTVGYLIGQANSETIVWQSRAGDASSSLSLGYNVVQAITDGQTVAWTSSDTPFYRLHYRPADGSGTSTTSDMLLGENHLLAPGAGVVTVAATGADGRFGMHRVRFDGSQPELIAPIEAEPAVITGVAVGGGALITVDDSVSSYRLWRRPVARTGPLAFGAETAEATGIAPKSAGHAETPVFAWGARVATYRNNPRRMVVHEGSTQIFAHSLAASDTMMGFNGRMILYADTTQPSNADYTQLLDVKTGTKTRVPFYATLTDRYVYGAEWTNAGAVTRTDLLSGTSQTVREPDGCTISALHAYGEWLGWSCATQQGWRHEVRNPDTGEIFSVPSNGVVWTVGDGVLVYETCDDPCVIRMISLRDDDRTPATVGTKPYTMQQAWRLDDEGGRLVAWVGTDSRAHVARLQPPATTLPEAVASVTAGLNQATIGWTLPWDPRVDGVIVRGTSGLSAPATTGDGTEIYRGSAPSVTLKPLSDGSAYSYRVFVTGAGLTSTGTPVTVRGTRLPISVMPERFTYTTATIVRGSLADTAGGGLAGRTVRVYQRPLGSTAWSALATLTSSSTGNLAFSHKPWRNTQYMMRFEGAGGNMGVTSVVKTAWVASRITAALDRSRIARGSSARVSGNLWPAHVGQLVALQTLTSSGWRTVTWAKLTSRGYAFAVRPASKGTFRYRIYKAADADHAGAVSPTVTLSVV